MSYPWRHRSHSAQGPIWGPNGQWGISLPPAPVTPVGCALGRGCTRNWALGALEPASARWTTRKVCASPLDGGVGLHEVPPSTGNVDIGGCRLAVAYFSGEPR